MAENDNSIKKNKAELKKMIKVFQEGLSKS